MDDIKKTIAEMRKVTGDGDVDSGSMAVYADALEAEHQRAESYFEGLYNVYVQLGEDTDGARDARALFGPMTQTDPAEWLPRLVRANRCEWEDEAERMEAERDALREAIDETRTILVAGSIPLGMTEAEFFKGLVADAFHRLSRAIDTKEKIDEP